MSYQRLQPVVPPSPQFTHTPGDLRRVYGDLRRFHDLGDALVKNEAGLTAYANTLAVTTFPMTLAAHGFAVKDVVYKTATGWAKAKADAAGTAADGVVVAVGSTSTFTVCTLGLVTISSHGLTVGSQYWLSAATAGAITTTKPGAGNYPQQILKPLSATELLISVQGAVLV